MKGSMKRFSLTTIKNRSYCSIPFGYEFVNVKRSELKIGDIVGIKDIKFFKLISIQNRSTGCEGYGESWNVFDCKEVDENLQIKKDGKGCEILRGFYSEEGDQKFEKLIETKAYNKLKNKLDEYNK